MIQYPSVQIRNRLPDKLRSTLPISRNEYVRAADPEIDSWTIEEATVDD